MIQAMGTWCNVLMGVTVNRVESQAHARITAVYQGLCIPIEYAERTILDLSFVNFCDPFILGYARCAYLLAMLYFCEELWTRRGACQQSLLPRIRCFTATTLKSYASTFLMKALILSILTHPLT